MRLAADAVHVVIFDAPMVRRGARLAAAVTFSLTPKVALMTHRQLGWPHHEKLKSLSIEYRVRVMLI